MELAILLYILVAVAVFIRTFNDGWQGAAAWVIAGFWAIMVPATSAFVLTIVYAITRGR